MIRLTAVVSLVAGLAEPDLTDWIERGWVQPEPAESGPMFRDIDIARVRLIQDLRVTMRIEVETISLILSLLDQVYESRGRLWAVVRAVEAQPAPIREAILAAIDAA